MSLARGGMFRGGLVCPEEGRYAPPWTDWQTDACENITFPQLLLRAVIILMVIPWRHRWRHHRRHPRRSLGCPSHSVLPCRSAPFCCSSDWSEQRQIKRVLRTTSLFRYVKRSVSITSVSDWVSVKYWVLVKGFPPICISAHAQYRLCTCSVKGFPSLLCLHMLSVWASLISMQGKHDTKP